MSSMPAPTLLVHVVVQMLPYRPRVARRLAAVMGLIRCLRKTHGDAGASVFIALTDQPCISIRLPHGAVCNQCRQYRSFNEGIMVVSR